MRKMLNALFRRLLISFVAAVFVCSLLAASSTAAVRELVEIHRVVTIGDVHGDAENFLEILRIADLVESPQGGAFDVLADPPKWKFSQAPNGSVSVHATLVQLGDLVDRGEQDFESLNIAIALQEQTQQSSLADKVILLIGNHELLNIQGYYHYVNKRNYGGFMSKPLRVEAMNADGAFGRYIVENFKTAHVEEDTLFVHAGIELDVAVSSVDSLNSQVQEALRSRNFRHAYLRSNGPLWTRKMISDSMLGECQEVEAILQKFNVARVVVGHTPQHTGHIEQYCDGRVIAADVGMSRWMYNNVAALELVFLKYFDTERQQTTTNFIIRELRDGSKTFSPAQIKRSTLKDPGVTTSEAIVNEGENDGDL